MTTSVLSKPLQGIIPPLVTPLSGRDTLDVTGLKRLIEHVLAGGVHGLFILGTTGEAQSLSYRLRRELIDRVCEQVDNRVPVLVGVTDTSFVESVEMASYAASKNADGVVLAPPYYLPAGQPELVEYIEHIVPELSLPVYLYNMPSLTKVQLELETLKQVSHLKGIAGVKDSSGDPAYAEKVIELIKQVPHWTLLVGPEHLTSTIVQLGGHGGINGGANVWPDLFVDMYNTSLQGDIEKIELLQKQIEAFGALYKIGHHSSAIIKGLKCALSCLGICDDFMAEPFHRFHTPERNQVEAILRKLSLLSN